jgi:hypothetical protein
LESTFFSDTFNKNSNNEKNNMFVKYIINMYNFTEKEITESVTKYTNEKD